MYAENEERWVLTWIIDRPRMYAHPALSTRLLTCKVGFGKPKTTSAKAPHPPKQNKHTNTNKANTLVTRLPKSYRNHYATLKVHVGVGGDCPSKAGIPLTCTIGQRFVWMLIPLNQV